ncbi:MAG TPA: C-GCAxxG-C-C family protein [Armatimonadota bacterium]|jgi:C_GCAxxG_C_C family probable redox protein
MRELKAQGFFCSQIILIMALELRGEENPQLVRAAHGLAGGIGFAGELCGALTGGGCLLGLYAGKGTPEEEDDPRLLFMAEDLVRWFKQEYEPVYGGLLCTDIIEGNNANKATRCPVIVAATLHKVKELLVENGFDLSGMDR